MLELQAHHSSRCFMATVFNEDGMGGGDQGSVLFICVTRIEWHTEHETVRFDGMLVHCPFVPDLIGGSVVRVAEVAVKEVRR